MPTPQIFISYRRDDTAGYARAIGDALGRHFGDERVFIDVDDIDAGQTFDTVIHQAVDEARVLLVLIGRRWLGLRDGQSARIEDADDLVRREVATALARGMQVIPLLVDGASMPEPAQLPADLQPLHRRNALAIDHARFGADMARLLTALKPLVDASPAPANAPPTSHPAPAPRPGLRWALGAAALLLLGGALWFTLRPTAPTPPAAAASAPAAARPAVNGSWSAEVSYDWPNAHYTERFEFSGEGSRLQGSASFLRVARGIEQGAVDPAGLHFVTRSTEQAGSDRRETEHRYDGTLVGDELRLVMQTVGGSTAHAPVQFVARRVAVAPAAR